MKFSSFNTCCSAGATVALAAFLALPALGAGSDLDYNFDTIFSANSVAPSGSAPWVAATFVNTNGGVLLTITNANLVGAEKLDSAYFNLNPSLSVSSLSFTLQSQVGSFTVPQPTTGEDNFKADGDGYYDIQLGFKTSSADSFTGGESLTYLITGPSNLSASDFAYLSTEGVNSTVGPYYAAVHVQGTGPTAGNSAWIEPGAGPTFYMAAPEPGTGSLAALGAGLWYAARHLRRRNRV